MTPGSVAVRAAPRAALLAALPVVLLAASCRTPPPRRPPPSAPSLRPPRVDDPAGRPSEGPGLAERIAAADLRMSEVRAHSSWPTTEDRERSLREIATAEAAREEIDAIASEPADAAQAQRLAAAVERYENAAAIAFGSFTLFRWGDRARGSR